MSAEHEAWDQFERWVRDARAALDGMVPIALICLPALGAADDGAVNVDVDVSRGGRILWPADFPVDDRGPLLQALAHPYRQGTVSR